MREGRGLQVSVKIGANAPTRVCELIDSRGVGLKASPDSSNEHDGECQKMLESKSAASVSPTLVYELDNNCTYTFNFQMDGRVMLIGFQDGRAVTGAFNEEQVAELRDAFTAYLEKRKG